MDGPGSYGLRDPLTHGLTQERNSKSASAIAPNAAAAHPLEAPLRLNDATVHAAEMKALASIQGFHAPLKIAMERAAVSKVGHLPCITGRSRFNVSHDVLTGRDETIDFEDLYGKPEDCEGMQGLPHVAIERALGMGRKQ